MNLLRSSRVVVWIAIGVAMICISQTAVAFGKPKEGGQGLANRPQQTNRKPTGTKQQQILERFDTNGNGKLDPDEMAAARKAAAERRRNKNKPDRDAAGNGEGIPNAGNGPQGLDGFGPGQAGPPRGNGRAKIMERFDLDRDGQLNEEEQARFQQFMQQRAGQFGGANGQGPGFAGPGVGGLQGNGARGGRPNIPPGGGPAGGKPRQFRQ
jgi:hypothetical protein